MASMTYTMLNVINATMIKWLCLIFTMLKYLRDGTRKIRTKSLKTFHHFIIRICNTSYSFIEKHFIIRTCNTST